MERIHVVEEDDIDSGFDRFFDLFERFAFDFDLHHVRCVAAHAIDCLADSTDGGDMIVFKHHAIEETHAVVMSTSASHRVFFERAEHGSCFAGVDDLGVRAFDALDELAGEGGYAAHVHKEVEGGALTGENFPGEGFAFDDFVASLDEIAIDAMRFDPAVFGLAMHRAEEKVGDAYTTEKALGLGFDLPSEKEIFVEAAAGEVSAAYIL